MSKNSYKGRTIPVNDVSLQVQMRPQNLRKLIREDKFPPGFAYQNEYGDWRYVVLEDRFKAWMNGTFVDTEVLIKAIVDEIDNRYKLQLRPLS